MSHWFDRQYSTENAMADVGVVAFADTGRAWVAAGEPIASADDAIVVAERFAEAATVRGRRVAFFATEGILAASPRFHRTLIGEQPVWDPRAWDDKVRRHRSMREQLRRARAKGVRVRALTSVELEENPRLRNALYAVVVRWLAGRPMARMGFLVDVDPLRNLEHRQLFVATRGDEPLALLSLAPVPARNGWLFEHVLREARAPNGTAELLIDHAMRELAGQQVSWASLGLAPLAGNVDHWLRAVRTLSRPFFNFHGLSAFKRKLRPDAWAPIYLVYPREQRGVRALLDGLRAFAGRPLLLFVLLTALRGPPPLLRALEMLLVPWTIALAFVPTAPWFPSAFVHSAWILFDAALLLALRWLRMRPDPRLAVAIAGAVSVDALLTMLQAVAFTVPSMQASGRATSLAWIAVITAVAGPLIAAPILWGAARRHAQLWQGPSRPRPDAR